MRTMRNRDQLAVCADYVKENISAIDVGHALGLDIRRGRCKCPIHNGSDYNCALYPGNRGYKCFSCGSVGDVIKLVRSSNPGMTFPDSLRWFNSTFGLGMNIDSPVDEKRLKSAKNSLKRKRDEQAFQERVNKAHYNMYLAVLSLEMRLEEQRDSNRPLRYGDEWNKDFCDAVRLLPEVREYADYFLIKCTEKKQ